MKIDLSHIGGELYNASPFTNGITPYYWSSQDKAELYFVFQDKQENIIPL